MSVSNILVVGYGTITKGVVKNILEKSKINITVLTSKEKVDAPVSIINSLNYCPKNLDAIIACLPNDKASIDFWSNNIILEVINSRKCYCIELSTLSYDYILEWHKLIKGINGRSVESPLTGSKTGANSGNLSLFFYGEKSIEPILKLFSKKIYNFSSPGEPMKFKLLYNLWGANILFLLAEFLPLIKKEFESIDNIVDIISNDGWMAPVCKSKFSQSFKEEFEDVHFKLGYMVKDINYALRIFKHYNLPVSELISKYYFEACDDTSYHKDFSIITQKWEMIQNEY